jgi:hypothetical protein
LSPRRVRPLQIVNVRHIAPLNQGELSEILLDSTCNWPIDQTQFIRVALMFT